MPKAEADLARRLAWIAVAAYVVGLGIAAVLRVQADFDTYYLAGARAAHSEPIYRMSDQSLFLYAPVFALSFAPLAMLPLVAAQAVWFAINAAALLALIFGASALIFGRGRRLPAALIVLPVLFSARFIDNNIEHGQINLITLALAAWAIVLAQPRPRSAGAMLAVAILIKPYAILAALYLALRRSFAPIRWTLGGIGILLLLPMVFFGWRGALDQTRSYLSAVLSMAGRYRLMLTNQSAVSAVARMIAGKGYSAQIEQRLPMLLGMAVEAILVGGVSVWIVRSSAGRRDLPAHAHLALCGVFCLMPSLAPVSWKSYYAALLIPYMAIFSTLWIDSPADLEPSSTAWMFLVLSIVLNLASGSRLNRVALFYSAHFAASILLLAALFAAWRSDEKQVNAGSAPSLTELDR